MLLFWILMVSDRGGRVVDFLVCEYASPPRELELSMDAMMMTSPGPRLSSMCVPNFSILRKNRGIDLGIRKLGFPRGSNSKEYACNAGDLALIPGLGRSPGGGHGNPLQYSPQENPHGQRSLAGYSPWGHKESDMTE